VEGNRFSVVFLQGSGWIYFKIKDVRKLLYACVKGNFLELQILEFCVIFGASAKKKEGFLYIGILMVLV